MAKKRLNRKVALVGSVIFLFLALLIVGLCLHLSGDPQKFIEDGDAAMKAAQAESDKELRKSFCDEAERNYGKAYRRAKTDELKVETLYRLSDVFRASGKWREVLGCWTQIVRLDPKQLPARYNRLKYFYIVADARSGMVWQDVETQVSELIELVESPGTAGELATADTSKWEIDQLKIKGEKTRRLVPYLYLIRGRANLEMTRLGIVTNKEESLKKAFADLEKVKQLEPANSDVYPYLARATVLKGEIEASKGDTDAKVKRREEAIELLKQGVEATNDELEANIALLGFKFNSIEAASEGETRKKVLAMEPEFLALGTKFGSNAEAFAAIAGFYSDYRLGPTYLDKSIEAIEKARELDSNNVDYAVTAASLLSRRFNIRKQQEDWNKIIEISQNALLLPDAQETTGPRSVIVDTYRLRLNSALASSFLDRILDSTEPLEESEGQRLLAEAQKASRNIEQIYGSGDDPQVVKWQGLVELAAAKLQKGDVAPATRKLYKIYTQLKASARSDPYLSYRLAKVFANSPESGAVGDFLYNAMENGIESSKPEARLDYTELLLTAGLWKQAIESADLFEQRCGVTERSSKLRISAYIGAREFTEARQYLEKMPQDDPNWMTLRVAILEETGRQARMLLERKAEKPKTGAVLQQILSKQQPQQQTDQRTAEQLKDEIKSNLSSFVEYMDKLLEKDPNLINSNTIASMCEDAIAAGQADQVNVIVDKVLKYQPFNATAKFYKRRMNEPDPAKVPDERWKQLNEEVLLETADPVRQASLLGSFYLSIGEPNKAEEQLKKLVGIIGDAEALRPDGISRQRAAASLFEIALGKKDWELADKIEQMARRENFDDCSGEFFAARLAFAKGQYENALASVENALKQRPVFSYGYLLRSRINTALGNEAAALTDIQSAASTNFMDRNIARELARRLYLRNQKFGDNASSVQLSEARAAIDWAMALNPGDLEMMSFYAEYISANDPERALALRQSLQENAPSVKNAILLARLATKLALDARDKQREEALRNMAFSALEQAKILDPQNPAVLESYAEFYRQTGQQRKAEQVLEESKEPRLLWRYYLRAGQLDNARKVLEQSLQDNPKDVNVIKGLLYIAERMGDKESIIKYADQLISVENIPENHLLTIQTYLNTGLVDEAKKKLASFRERYPADGEGLLLSAWLSMKQGRIKEALELTNKCLEGNQNDAVAWRLRGQISHLLGNYDQAIADLKRSKNLLDTMETRIALARAYLRAKRQEDAIIELKGAVEDPQTPEQARVLLEDIYIRTNRKGELKNFYAKLLEQFPDSVYWHNRAAGFEANEGNIPKAEQLFYTALQKSQEQGRLDRDALDLYLRALLAAEKYDKLFEEATKYIDGEFAYIAYSRMAEGKMAIGDKAAATQYCSKAIDKTGEDIALNAAVVRKVYGILGQNDTENICRQKLDANPNYDMANWTMYNVYLLKGDYNKANQHIDVCIKAANPDKPEWTEMMMKKAELLGLAYAKTSDKNYLDAVMEVYESLIAKMPNNAHVLNNMAYILAENNRDLDKALEYIKRANEVMPNDPGFLDTYALVLYKQGKYAEAAEFSEASIQQYEARQIPVIVDVYEHSGQIHERLGKVSKAHAAYEQALEAGGANLPTSVKERLTAAIERLGKIKTDDSNGQ